MTFALSGQRIESTHADQDNAIDRALACAALDGGDVHVFGEPSDTGKQRLNGRWCDEPETGYRTEVIYHREPLVPPPLSGGTTTVCLTCGYNDAPAGEGA